MTGSVTPRRHISSPRVKGYRLDANAAAVHFRERMIFSAAMPTLDANILTKVLGPNLKSSGSADSRTVTGKSNSSDDELVLPQFDPDATKKPGQVPKLHVTYRELRDNPDGPHFGWVDPPKTYSNQEAAANLQKAFRWRASQPEITFQFSPRDEFQDKPFPPNSFLVKGLGPTLREMNPSGTIDLAAAIARGAIVDLDGKLRCPPGTPNANQFTDEFLSNCMVGMRRGVRRLVGNVMARFNKLVMEGAELEKQRNAPQRFAKARENLASPQEVAEAAARRSENIKTALSKLGVTLDSSFNGDYVDALLKIEELGDGPEVKDLFNGGAIDASGNPFVWDDSQSTLENLRRYDETLVSTYEDLLLTGIYTDQYGPEPTPRVGEPGAVGDEKPTYEEFKARLTDAQRASLASQAERLRDRHQAHMRGVLGSFVELYESEPEQLKLLSRISSMRVGDDELGIQEWWHTGGYTHTEMTRDGTFSVAIMFNPYSEVMKPFHNGFLPSRGRGDAVATWAVSGGRELNEVEFNDFVETALAEIADGITFYKTVIGDEPIFAQNISASGVAGLSDQNDRNLAIVEAIGAHVAYHEFGHVLQYSKVFQVIEQTVTDDNPVFPIYDLDENGMPIIIDSESIKKPLDQWTNDDWSKAVNQLMQGPAIGYGYPPVNTAMLEESMLHLITGARYQTELSRLGGLEDAARVSGLNPDSATDAVAQSATAARIAQLKLMVHESTAELYALKRMGVIRGDDVDAAIGHMEDVRAIPGQKTARLFERSINPPNPAGINTLGKYVPTLTKRSSAKPRASGAAQRRADDARGLVVAADVSSPSELLAPSGTDIVGNEWSAVSRLISIDGDSGIGDKSAISQPAGVTRITKQMVDSTFDLSPGAGGSAMSHGEMTPEMLDARFDELEARTSELLSRDSLTQDEQGRLWLATQEKLNIISENNYRRRQTEREISRNEARGRQTRPGRNVSPLNDTETQQEISASLEATNSPSVQPVISDDNELKSIKASIGMHVNDGDQELKDGRPGYAPTSARKARAQKNRQSQLQTYRKEQQTAQLANAPQEQRVIATSVSNHNERSINSVISRGTLAEKIAESAARADELDANKEVAQMSTPDGEADLFADELDGYVFPTLELTDSSSLDDDVEVIMEVENASGLIRGESIPRGFERAVIADSELGRQMLADEGDSRRYVRTVVRRGDKGVYASRNNDDTIDSLLLPPGKLAVTEIDDKGSVTAIIHTQESKNSVASKLSADLDAISTEGMSGSQTKQVAAVRKSLKRASSDPSGGSADVFSPNEKMAEAQSLATMTSLADTGSAPFAPTQDFVTQAALDYSQAKELGDFGPVLTRDQHLDAHRAGMSSAVETFRRLASGDIRPSSDEEADFIDSLNNGDISADAVNFMLNSSNDDVIALVNSELLNLHRSTSNRVQLAASEDMLAGLISGKPIKYGDTSNSFSAIANNYQETIGFRIDAPDDLRPVSVDVSNEADSIAIQRALDSLPRGGVSRSADFFERSPGSDKSSVILHPAASQRAAYGVGDLPGTRSQPVQITSTSADDVSLAMMPSFRNSDSRLGNATILGKAVSAILANDRNGLSELIRPSSDAPLSGLLPGGVHRDDIDFINIPSSLLGSEAQELSLNEMGFSSPEALSRVIGRLGINEAKAASILKDISNGAIRIEGADLARIRKSGLELHTTLKNRGITVNVSNKYGVDVFSPDSFRGLPYVGANDDMDTIIKKLVHADITEFLSANKEAIETGKFKRPTISDSSRTKPTGMRSLTFGTKLGLKLAQSERGAALLRRAGVQEDDIETVQFVGDMAGLAFRFKTTAGIAKKIKKYMDKGATLEEAMKKVNDSLRYTMLLDDDTYVDGAKEALERIGSMGHEILEIKNYWDEGDAYQGINVVVMHPGGFKYELQFHTPKSLEIKEQNHIEYDAMQKSIDSAERFKLYKTMAERAQQIPIPVGELDKVGKRVFEPFEEKSAIRLRRATMRTQGGAYAMKLEERRVRYPKAQR